MVLRLRCISASVKKVKFRASNFFFTGSITKKNLFSVPERKLSFFSAHILKKRNYLSLRKLNTSRFNKQAAFCLNVSQLLPDVVLSSQSRNLSPLAGYVSSRLFWQQRSQLDLNAYYWQALSGSLLRGGNLAWVLKAVGSAILSIFSNLEKTIPIDPVTLPEDLAESLNGLSGLELTNFKRPAWLELYAHKLFINKNKQALPASLFFWLFSAPRWVKLQAYSGKIDNTARVQPFAMLKRSYFKARQRKMGFKQVKLPRSLYKQKASLQKKNNICGCTSLEAQRLTKVLQRLRFDAFVRPRYFIKVSSALTALIAQCSSLRHVWLFLKQANKQIFLRYRRGCNFTLLLLRQVARLRYALLTLKFNRSLRAKKLIRAKLNNFRLHTFVSVRQSMGLSFSLRLILQQLRQRQQDVQRLRKIRTTANALFLQKNQQIIKHITSPIQSAVPLPLAHARQPALLFGKFAQKLKQDYRIRYYGLDRRVRKILKGKYAYTRKFECLNPRLRLSYSTRLVRVALRMQEGAALARKLTCLFTDVHVAPTDSWLLLMRSQQRQTVLSVLSMRSVR